MFRELVEKNRSYRGYDESVRVSKDDLLEFVDLTRYVASSVNMQPLKYYICYEKEKVDALQKLTKWARALPELDLPYPGMRPTAFIVICQDTSINSNLNRFLRDIGAVAQTMLLAAVERGFGGCMIGNFDKGDVKSLLGLDENLEPNLIVAFGKPDEEIVITDIKEDGDTNYYRDATGRVHYVPKRSLEEIVLNNNQ